LQLPPCACRFLEPASAGSHSATRSAEPCRLNKSSHDSCWCTTAAQLYSLTQAVMHLDIAENCSLYDSTVQSALLSEPNLAVSCNMECLNVRLRQDGLTLPAQKISRSAKYWVAKSPMANLDRTILAPDSTHLSSLS